MSGLFRIEIEAGQAVCLACGARIANTDADKIEHLTTPSRCRARDKQRRNLRQNGRLKP